MTTVREFINQHGTRWIAQKTGVTPAAVRNWRREGAIPLKHWPALVAASKRLTPSALARMHTKRTT